jgi:Flp pilus assembly pilin Flp
MNINKNQAKNRRGQAIAEYLILVALVGIASIAVIQVLSTNLRRKIGDVANAIGGKSSEKIESKKVEADQYEIKDLSNFKEGIRDAEK